MVTVKWSYTLSPEGRKAALLAGMPATVNVSATAEVANVASYADVIRVDTTGAVEIFYRHGIGDFAATPSFEEFVAAIRAEIARREKLREKEAIEATELAAKIAAAEAAFLADPSARCACVPQQYGWFRYTGVEVRFDADNPAHAEARLRYLADCAQAVAEAARKDAARAAWARTFLSEHSLEMLARFDAGLLPDDELKDAIQGWTFAPLTAPLFEWLDECDFFCDCGELDITFRSIPAESATAEEFAALEAMRTAVADNDRLFNARISLRTHIGECACGNTVTRTGILVTGKIGPFDVRWEFAVNS